MKYLPALAAVCLLIVPSVALAQHIFPNPNPAGHTITVDTSGRFNSVGFDNNGTIEITSDGTLTNRINGVLTNNAHSKINNAVGGTLINNGMLVNDWLAEMTNDGTFANAWTMTNNATLTNNGKFTNDMATLTNNRTLINTGTLSSSGYSVKFNNYGTLHNKSGGTLNMDIGGSGSLPGEKWGLTNYGTLKNESGGTLNNTRTVNNEWMLNNLGTLSNNSKATLNNSFLLINNKTLQNDYRLYNNAQAALENFGTLKNTWLLDNRHGGTLANSGTIEIAGGGTLTNDGILDITDGGTLINDGSLVNHSDGTLINDGTIDTSQSVKGAAGFTNNGTYQGSGIVIGKWTDHGHIKSGNPAVLESAGVMTTDGDYYKREGSHEIELGGLFDGGGDHAITEFDWIDVTGNVELAGLLNVSLIDGFELHRGNWFDILRVGGTLSGQYEGLGEGALVGNFGGQDLFITYGGMGDGGGVALYTNAVPEPTTVLIWSMLAGLGMTVRRRR